MLLRSLVRTLCLLMLAGCVFASSEEAAPEEDARGFKYIEMSPSLVVNVGEAGKVGFLKADISLRVESVAVPSVEHHMPALRHALILLLSSQDDKELQSTEGREAVRLAALEAVREVIKEADHVEGVTDLLFTSFLVQR